MDTLATDLRLALRQIRRRPVFAIVAALSLAIGVGANTAIFSAVSALLLRPVPGVRQPDRVVELGRTQQGHGFDSFTYPDYVDVRDQVAAFQSAAAYTWEVFSLSRGGEGERITGMQVTPSYFDVMGVRPALGRFFTEEEDRPGGDPTVVVLDHDFWRARLGGDPSVVGSTVRINRVSFTVVGVAPDDFHGHTVGFRPDVYMPLRAVLLLKEGWDQFDNRGASWHQAVARLAPGATVEEADTQVKGVFTRLGEAYPDVEKGRSASVVPLGLVPGAARTGVSAFLGVLMGMAGLMLLVTCTNVAGMFIARATSREKEIAVRLALGSGRRRLVRQLLTEALAIFILGGAVGGALGAGVLGLVPVDRLPLPIDISVDLSPDLRVLAFALAVTLLTGVAFGLLPALQATRLSLVPALKDDGSHHAGVGRLRRVFVSGQVGLSLVLLVAAGLFLRSLQRAARVETGFDATDTYLTQVDLSLEGYDPERGAAFQHQLDARLAAIPGVQAAGLSIDLPLDLGSHGTSVVPEGWTGPGGREGVGVGFNFVSPGYFDALKIPVERGRVFTGDDGAGAEPVAVVSRTFADRVWPGEPAVGHRLRVQLAPMSEEWRTVVGVVEDVKNQVLTEQPKPFVYLPLWQVYRPSLRVVVRAPGGIA
ncbi:MAG: ABC transporter permease, partial [Gemmatimonadota bacterium]